MATTEYRRFLLEEVNAGEASGWHLVTGWFATQQTAWAWFARSVEASDAEGRSEGP